MTRQWSSTGTNPPGSHGIPATRGPSSFAIATTWSAEIERCAQVKLTGGVIGHLGRCDELDLSLGQQLGDLIARQGAELCKGPALPA